MRLNMEIANRMRETEDGDGGRRIGEGEGKVEPDGEIGTGCRRESSKAEFLTVWARCVPNRFFAAIQMAT
eukprot:4559719-Pleurochrysis_carterae.AAC.2